MVHVIKIAYQPAGAYPKQQQTPTPQQTALLKSITNQFHKFKSNAVKEIGLLYELRQRDPRLSTEINNIQSSLNTFLETTNKFFVDKGGYSGQLMLDSLNELLGNLTNIPADTSVTPSDAAGDVYTDQQLSRMPMFDFAQLYNRVKNRLIFLRRYYGDKYLINLFNRVKSF